MRRAYETVLVPIDFSAGSRAAVRHLERLLPAQTAVHIHLVHVIEPLGSSPPPPLWEDYNRERERDARRQLKHLGARVREQLQLRAAVGVHVLRGAAYDAICRLAAQLRADLIVIGTHGRSGVMHFFLGSVAERVVRHAGRPVLTVPLRGPRSKRT